MKKEILCSASRMQSFAEEATFFRFLASAALVSASSGCGKSTFLGKASGPTKTPHLVIKSVQRSRKVDGRLAIWDLPGGTIPFEVQTVDVVCLCVSADEATVDHCAKLLERSKKHSLKPGCRFCILVFPTDKIMRPISPALDRFGVLQQAPVLAVSRRNADMALRLILALAEGSEKESLMLACVTLQAMWMENRSLCGVAIPRDVLSLLLEALYETHSDGCWSDNASVDLEDPAPPAPKSLLARVLDWWR